MLRALLVALTLVHGIVCASAQIGPAPGGGMIVPPVPPPPSCSQSAAYFARTANLDYNSTVNVDALICGMVADGDFCGAKFDVIYAIAVNDFTAATTNLCSAQFSGSVAISSPPNFSPFNGIAGSNNSSATSNNLITNFIPTLAGGNYSQNSAHVSVFILSENPSNQAVMGMPTSGSPPSFTNLFIDRPVDGKVYCRINDSPSSAGIPISAQIGWTVCNRSGASASQIYRTGALFASPNETSGGLQAASISIVLGTNVRVAFATIGGSLDAPTVSRVNARICTFLIAQHGSCTDTAPSVAVTTPTPSQVVTGQFQLSATASAVGGIVTALGRYANTGVQFIVDGTPICVPSLISPYSCFWNSAVFPDGAHSIVAVATDNAGNTTTSATVNFTTSNGTTNKTYTIVASGGSDANNCIIPTPCSTIARANTLSFLGGDHLQFNGGDAFSGCVNIPSSQIFGMSSAHPLTIESGGVGQATLNGNCFGTLTATVMLDGINAVLQNLTIHGTGVATTSPHACVWIQNSTGPQTVDGIVVQGNNIGGCSAVSSGSFGANVFMTGFPNVASIPIRNVSILNNTICGLSGPSSVDQNGISGFGNGNNINGVEYRGNVVCNNGAASGGTAGTLGNGLLAGGTIAAKAHFNLIHNNGGNSNQCGGPAGQWAANADGFTSEKSEIYQMQPIAYTAGCDWDSSDCDVGATNCTIQYIYSHNNFGPGFLGGFSTGTWGPMTLRWSISENDGFLINDGSAGVISLVGPGGTMNVYNMTAYTNPNGVAGRAPSIFSIATFVSPVAAGGIFNSIFAAGKTQFNQAQFAHIPSMGSSTFVMKNNVYWALSGGAFYSQLASTGVSSLAAWQAIAPGGETGATTTNPALAGTPTGTPCVWTPSTDPGPQSAGCPTWAALNAGSPARGSGLDLTQPPYNFNIGTQDYYGNTIPSGGGPNVGAFGVSP